MKTIVTIMISLFLLSSVSALFAGECMEVDLSDLDNSEDIFYMIVGNSSNTEGLNITLNDLTKNVSICTPVNYEPDSFSIIFMNNLTGEIIIEVPIYRSSGGRRTRYVYIDNKTIEYVENKTIEYVDRIIDLTEDKVPAEEEITIDILDEPEKSYWYYYLAVFVILAIIIYLFYRTSFKESEEKIIDEDTIEKEVK